MKFSTLSFKKTFQFALLLLAVCLTSNECAAQQTTDEVYFKHWTRALETKNHLDINYRVLKCGDKPAQVHLQIFNESKLDQPLDFNVKVKNSNGESFNTDIHLDTKKTSGYTAWCEENDQTGKLKISIPANYDPTQNEIIININK